MSMLYHFLSAEVYGKPNQGLFNDLKIAQWEEFENHQGKYPTVFITFKDIKEANFKSSYDFLAKLLSNLYGEHSYLLSSPRIDEYQKTVRRFKPAI